MDSSAPTPQGMPARWSGSVLVVGGANMDITAQSLAPLVLADSNPGQVRYSPGGVARNVAENLARLGQRVSLMTVLGDDAWGHRVQDLMRSLGVQMPSTETVSGAATPCYLAVHGADGDMAVAVNDMQLLERITPDWLHARLPLIRSADYLVADCNLSAAALMALQTLGEGLPLAVDAVSAAKCERVRALLPRLDLLKLNRLEAQTLTGLQVTDVPAAMQAAKALRGLGCRQVVISLGADGAVWADQQHGTGHAPVAATPVVNTSGAGDAMMAGLVFGLAGGWSLPQSLAWGLACAQLTLTSDRANADALQTDTLFQLASRSPAWPTSLMNDDWTPP